MTGHAPFAILGYLCLFALIAAAAGVVALAVAVACLLGGW